MRLFKIVARRAPIPGKSVVEAKSPKSAVGRDICIVIKEKFSFAKTFRSNMPYTVYIGYICRKEKASCFAPKGGQCP